MDVQNDQNTPIYNFFKHYGHKGDQYCCFDEISQTVQSLKLILFKHHTSLIFKANHSKEIVVGQFYIHCPHIAEQLQAIKNISKQSIKKIQSSQFKNANTLMPIYFGMTNKHLVFYSLKQRYSNEKFQLSMINLHFWCEINFDIKFEILRENWADQFTPGVAKGIKLQRPINNIQNILINQVEYESLQLYSTSEVVEQFMYPLQRTLNQRNFHNLFKAKKKIGKGAFGTVYLAQRLLDNGMIAVKAFSKEKQFSTKNGKQALINEITLLRAIDHKNILKLLQIYETKNSLYMLMDNLQGGQLDQRIKQATKKYADQLPMQLFSNLQIKVIIKSLLEATSYLKRIGIIHRDIKPQNIMFKHPNSFQAVLCDFGLATYADSQNYIFVRCGTPGYVAPQIINIRDLTTKSDPISDIFSVGIIMHLLLFGISVFPGKNYQDILTQNRLCNFDFNHEIYKKYVANGSQCQLQALQLMKRMLQTNPNKRITAENALSLQYFSGEITRQTFINLSNVMDIQDDSYSNISKFQSQKYGQSSQKEAFNIPSKIIKRNSQASKMPNMILEQEIYLKHYSSNHDNIMIHKKSNNQTPLSSKEQISFPQQIKRQISSRFTPEKVMTYSSKNNVNENLFKLFVQEQNSNSAYTKPSGKENTRNTNIQQYKNDENEVHQEQFK